MASSRDAVMSILNFSLTAETDSSRAKVDAVPTIDFASLLSFSPEKEEATETKREMKRNSLRGSADKARKAQTPKAERPMTARSGDSLYQRGQEFLHRKEERVAEWIHNEFSFRPELNPESVRLAGDRRTRKPLYEVAKEVPQKEVIEPEEPMKPKAKLNLSEFLGRNYTKQLELRSARAAPRPVSVDKECTFHPTVNSKSAQLVSEVSCTQKRTEDIYERSKKSKAMLDKKLSEMAKQNEDLAQRECTFAPKRHA